MHAQPGSHGNTTRSHPVRSCVDYCYRKYEEIFAPAVDEFVYISDNTYTREEILAMESKVLRHLDFRLTSATAKHFLRRFTRAAQANERERYLTNVRFIE